jgi:hypothetical protein
LNYVFRVLAILRNVLCDSKNVAIIPTHQFFKRFIVALLGRPYQCEFFTEGLLTYIGLDGTHS